MLDRARLGLTVYSTTAECHKSILSPFLSQFGINSNPRHENPPNFGLPMRRWRLGTKIHVANTGDLEKHGYPSHEQLSTWIVVRIVMGHSYNAECKRGMDGLHSVPFKKRIRVWKGLSHPKHAHLSQEVVRTGEEDFGGQATVVPKLIDFILFSIDALSAIQGI